MKQRGGKMTILLVEDQQSELIHLKKYVRECYPKDTIMEFNNAATALNYIMEHPVQMLFTGIQMKQVSGFALSEAVKENDRYAKVIFIADNQEYALAARKAYINDYLIKPITLESVRHTLAD